MYHRHMRSTSNMCTGRVKVPLDVLYTIDGVEVEIHVSKLSGILY